LLVCGNFVKEILFYIESSLMRGSQDIIIKLEQNKNMAEKSLADVRKVRLNKLRKIAKQGKDSYPSEFKRTHLISQVKKNFKVLARKKARVLYLCGRMMSRREHGALTFGSLRDGGGEIQVSFRRDILGKANYRDFLELIDIGDILELSGKLYLTRRGEETLEVNQWKLLSKAIRPLPEKWHGLANQETRFRQRYLDLLINPKVRERFILRHRLTQAIRGFLIKKGFIEVETPALQPLPGGALAAPFKTYYSALNAEVYLRIAPELYLKRLLIGGFEKIFEFARVFRNEGVSTQHLQDFTMLEFYQAYATYEDLMKLTEEMFSSVLKEVYGATRIKLGRKDTTVDFKAPWPRKTLGALILKETGINIDKFITASALKQAIKAKGIKLVYKGKAGRGKLIDELYKEAVRPKLLRPTFVTDHPVDLSPLAKRKEPGSDKVQRFQLVVGGWELINAFSELNDPIEQAERFREQAKLRKQGDREAHSADSDFVKALEYGMPPAAGWGMGIERLVALLTDVDSIREAVLFPFVKEK